MKPNGTKSAAKYYETFFVGEEGTQYFVKPIKFSNNEDEILTLDITFRYKDQVKDSATITFSFFSEDLIKKIDSISLSNKNIFLKSYKVDLMFNERDKGLIESRFSSKILLSDMVKLFNSSDWTMQLYSSEKSYTIVSNKKTNKIIDALNFDIFTLF